MSLRLQTQPDTIADRILRIAGKKRAYVMPSHDAFKTNPSAYMITLKESFWSALFRSSSKPLPEGFVSEDQMNELLKGAQ